MLFHANFSPIFSFEKTKSAKIFIEDMSCTIVDSNVSLKKKLILHLKTAFQIKTLQDVRTTFQL